MTRPFRLSTRLRSFRFAFVGLWTLLRTQHNAWIHAAATLAVVTAGFALGVTRNEWCWLTVAILGVWIAEAINTAFEFLADAVCPEHNPLVGNAKDVAAGAVLLAALGSVIIGVLVLGPYLLALVE